MKSLLLIAFLLVAFLANAQVDEIRDASSKNSHSSGSSSGDGDGESAFELDAFFEGVEMVFNGFDMIGRWQMQKLETPREIYPSMVSLDIMFQGAVKPSSYYVLWPRIRGNWGLFSTDFRMNYLIEDDIEGYKHIRTSDWQILQLNLITSKYIMFRLGSGIMTEAFAARRTFNETSFMFDVHAPDQTKVIGFEYRFAKDWNTGVNPRREFSIQYNHEFMRTGALHGYFSVGTTFQRYYNSIDVWGFQGGILFRFF